MSIVTCDVVEAGATGSSSIFASITTILATVGFGASSMVWGISSLLVSAGTAHETIDMQPVVSIVERGVAYDTMPNQANMAWVITERGAGSDALLIAPADNVIEQATAHETLSAERALTVTELAYGTSAALFTTGTAAAVVEHATAHETLFGYNDLDLIEHGSASTSVMYFTRSVAALVDQGVAYDTVLIDGAFDDMLSSTGYASSAMFTQTVATANILERAYASDRALLQMFGLGWVMNSEDFGMSRYTQLPVASLCVIKGRVFALGDTGMFELAGDTDDGVPIDAAISTGRVSLGTEYKKRVPNVYMTGAFADAMALTVSVYGDKKGSYTYTSAVREAASPRGTRFGLGKGLASTYWKFTLANQNGGDFNINTMSADVAPSTTRRL